jgi:hypothetical protein
MVYFNKDALFFIKCVFTFSSICTPLSIYLIKSVCEINLSVYFNRDVFFRFLFKQAISSVFALFINWLRITLLIFVNNEAAILFSD